MAAYQTSEAARVQTGAGVPFPGLAYTLFVEENGRTVLAWDLETRVWHSAARVDGVARNRSHIGICYAGNRAPSDPQIKGIANAINWCERQLGHHLSIEGHKDVYATTCPGPLWPTWKAALEVAVQALRR